MAFDLGEGKYQIVVDADGAIAAIKRFEGQADSSSKKAKVSFGSIAGNLTGLAASAAGTAFAFDNLSKGQLRVEQSAQKVAKAQERVNELVTKGKTHTKDYEIATEDLRLAQERQKQVTSDLQQSQIQFGLGLVTLTTSTIPNVIASFSKMAAGSAVATTALVTQTGAETALTASTWRSTFAFLANPIFYVPTAIAIAGAVAIIGTNTWGLRDAIFGVSQATESNTKSSNEMVNMFQGQLPNALKSSGKAAEGTAGSFDVLNASMENVKKNKNWFDNWIDDIPRQVMWVGNQVGQVENMISKSIDDVNNYLAFLHGKTTPKGIPTTEKILNFSNLDRAFANALAAGSSESARLHKSLEKIKTTGELNRWLMELNREQANVFDYELLLTEFVKKRKEISVKFAQDQYKKSQDDKYDAYIKSVRQMEKDRNLSDFDNRFKNLTGTSNNEKLNQLFREIQQAQMDDATTEQLDTLNDMLGRAINQGDKIAEFNIRNQITAVANERNFFQNRTMGISAKNITAGLDQFFRNVKMSGNTSFTAGLMGGGLAQFGGISRSMTDAINNSKASIARLVQNSKNKGRMTGVSVRGGGLGINRSDQSGSAGKTSGGKHGRHGKFTPAQIGMMMFRESLNVDDKTRMFADFLGLNVPNFAAGVGFSQSRASRQAGVENAQRMQDEFNQNAFDSRQEFLKQVQAGLLNLSNLSNLSVTEVQSMITTNQGKDDLTGIIDFQNRLKSMTSGVGF